VSLSFASTSLSLQGSSATTNSTTVSVAPFVGYFAVDGLELLGGVDVSFSSASASDSSSTNQTNLDLLIGAGYFFRLADNVRLGPAAVFDLGFGSASTTSSGGTATNVTLFAPFLQGLVQLKVAIHSAVLLLIGAGASTSLNGQFSGSAAGSQASGSFTKAAFFSSAGVAFYL
jgi:hypothetical protein